MFGRNGESPIPILAPQSPIDCFDIAIEAARLAIRAMSPVMILSEGYLANSSEPWKIPDVDSIPPLTVDHPGPRSETNGQEPFLPYQRDPETLARPWAIPGTPALEHRIGGLEKDYSTGHISYDADNHQRMTDVRAQRIAGIARDIPAQQVEQGPAQGKLAVVGWGSTYGPIYQAVEGMRRDGFDVSQIHLRYLNPFPEN